MQSTRRPEVFGTRADVAVPVSTTAPAPAATTSATGAASTARAPSRTTGPVPVESAPTRDAVRSLTAQTDRRKTTIDVSPTIDVEIEKTEPPKRTYSRRSLACWFCLGGLLIFGVMGAISLVVAEVGEAIIDSESFMVSVQASDLDVDANNVLTFDFVNALAFQGEPFRNFTTINSVAIAMFLNSSFYNPADAQVESALSMGSGVLADVFLGNATVTTTLSNKSRIAIPLRLNSDGALTTGNTLQVGSFTRGALLFGPMFCPRTEGQLSGCFRRDEFNSILTRARAVI